MRGTRDWVINTSTGNVLLVAEHPGAADSTNALTAKLDAAGLHLGGLDCDRVEAIAPSK